MVEMYFCRYAYPGQPYIIKVNITAEQVPIAFLEHVILTMSVRVEGYNVSYGIEDYNTQRDQNNWTAEQERDWLTLSHPRRGDIQIQLTSPSGTVSTLLPYRDLDFINNEGYEEWPFTSVQHWGENPVGEWTLNVTYRSACAHATMTEGELNLHGTEVVPQAIQDVPTQCDNACKRGCSGVGADECDACLVKRVSATLECVNECPEGTYLYKSHYCNYQGDYTNTTAPTGLPFSTIIMVISGSAVTGVTFAVTMTILICMCCASMLKLKSANERRYVRLQFDDLPPSPM